MIYQEDYRGFYLPGDLKSSVLFTRTQLLQLLNRKEVLDQEWSSLEKKKADKIKETRRKKKSAQEHGRQLEDAERDYEERQMLRFGNLVDLDSLEISGPSQAVIDL